jgi:hypothetical protein
MHESRLFVEQNFVGSGLSTLATVLDRVPVVSDQQRGRLGLLPLPVRTGEGWGHRR